LIWVASFVFKILKVFPNEVPEAGAKQIFLIEIYIGKSV